MYENTASNCRRDFNCRRNNVFPETMNQLPEGTSIFDALVADAMNIKEYNINTNQVADTLYDVGLEVSETMVDVVDKVEDTIDDVEISPNQILNLED